MGNGWARTAGGDTLRFNGLVWHGLLPGDLVLRPVVPRRGGPGRWVDHLLNRLVPHRFGHAMLYLGRGRLVNVRPDRTNAVSVEDAVANFREYGAVRRAPESLVFVRPGLPESARRKAAAFLLAHARAGTRFKHLARPRPAGRTLWFSRYDGFNCVGGIRLAYGAAGGAPQGCRLPPAVAAALPWPQRWFCRLVFTGFHLYAGGVCIAAAPSA